MGHQDHLPRAGRRRGLRAIAAAATGVALYLWDDALLAAPVIALTRSWGAARAFATATPLYFAGSATVTLVLLHALGSSDAPPPRLSRWIERQSERRGRTWVRRAAIGGGIVGFVLSSFVLGGIITTLILRQAGVRTRVEVIALTSSAIFALTFVGFYSGISRALLGVGR